MLSMRVSRSPLVRMPAIFTVMVAMALVVAGTALVPADKAAANPAGIRTTGSQAAPTPTATAVTASDDGYVTASEPTSRKGGTSTSLIEGTATTTRVVYLKFAVGSIPANTPVAVQLFSARASTIPARLNVVADVSWPQDMLTWNNRPAVGAQVASMTGVPLNNWVTFDVTNVVKGPGTYSFAVDSPSGGASNIT